MSRGVSVSAKGLNTDFASALTAELERQMMFIGEECVCEARSKTKENDWNDVTGNLRSSIGYSVVRDGETVAEGRPETFSGSQGHGEKGVSHARSLIARLRASYPRGLVLIVVAGMDYASNVEARGRNVLTSAKLKAETLVDRLKRQLAR